MVTDGGLSVAAISSALNFGYRSVQTGYELQAVPEQTQKLLATIETSKKDIRFAKSLRAKKSRVLNEEEKTHIDEKITDTEAALDGLEALVEAARVDMMTKFGRVSAWNRALWVVRDGPQVDTSLARINVAIIALNAVVSIMSLREGDRTADEHHFHSKPNGAAAVPPPTYKTSEFLHQRRTLRNGISHESTTTTSGSEAWGSDQDTEIVSEVSPYPTHLNPFEGVYELEGSHAHLPLPPRHATSNPIPDCLRAGPTALQLFGPVEDTTGRRSRATWLHEHARDTGTDLNHSRSPISSELHETEQVRRNNQRRLAWEVLNESAGDQPVQRQSWLAYRASLSS
jgi:hypothetical protein